MRWPSVQEVIEAAEKTKAQMIPSLISHCILAVKKKGHDTRAAWNICRASMTKYGYLKEPYKEQGKAAEVKMTQKGVRRSMRHSMEKEGPEKFKKFKRVFAKIEPTV